MLAVPKLSVSLSSSTNSVLDIIGYNSFTVHCNATSTPTFERLEGSFIFLLTRNDTINDTVSEKSQPSQGISIHQNAYVSSGADTLVYNCTVVFSINGSSIATASITSQIFVRGEFA